jgi:large subunit ribosomal protein L25
MSKHIVTARTREGRGKGPARRMRADGRIPAVLYGGGQDPVTLSIDPTLLVKALDPELKRNTLLHLEVEDQADISCTAMVKDTQIDPLKDQILHVDLLRVSADQAIEVKIPLKLVGRAKGVKLGGVLQQVYRDLPVLVPAGAIPAKIEIDVTDWDILDQFKAGDIALPDGVTMLLDPKLKVAAVEAGRAPEEEEEGEGEEGEGEEGEEGEGAKGEGEGDAKKAD